MISLTNKFIAVGTLSECKIELYPTHLRAKFGLRVDNNVLTIYYSINRKFHQDQYDELISLIPNLHSDIDCNVFSSNQPYYTMYGGTQTRLFISGNVTEKNNILFFNAGYIQLSEQKKDKLDITMSGVWTSKGFLNIVSDSPRLFDLDNNESISNNICNVKVVPNSAYDIADDVVVPLDKEYNLQVVAKKYTDKHLEEKDVANYLLEWEIISGESN